MTNVTRKDRETIRGEARRLHQRYRITAAGEVHFFGPMANSTETGWWLFAQSVAEAVEVIRLT